MANEIAQPPPTGLRQALWHSAIPHRLIAVSSLLLAAPWLLGPFELSLLNEILLFALFAMSLDLLLGYTGLPSLGHAGFFGLGAYAAGIIGSRISANLLLTLPLSLLLTAAVALVIGIFVLRVSGVSFLMLTFAFAQMLYAVAFKWTPVTGGSNGLAGIPRPVLDLGFWSLSFSDSLLFYELTALIVLGGYLALRRFVGSPWGQTLLGIRENEERMRALGYHTGRYKLAAFVIAGTTAGLAGYIYGTFNFFVSPQDLYWTMSGQVLIMVIIGGAGTLIGPSLGAGLVILLAKVVSSYTERWPSLMGVTFVLFVLFAPQGLLGLARAALTYGRSRWKR